MGRPPVDTEPTTVRIERTMITGIDDWRRRQQDMPTRPMAIRRLIAAALRQEGAKQ